MFKRNDSIPFLPNYKAVSQMLKPVYFDTFKNKCNYALLERCFDDPFMRILFKQFSTNRRGFISYIQAQREGELFNADLVALGFENFI